MGGVEELLLAGGWIEWMQSSFHDSVLSLSLIVFPNLCSSDVRYCPDSRMHLLCVRSPWPLPSAGSHRKWWHLCCGLDWYLCWLCTPRSVYPRHHWSHKVQQDFATGGKCSNACPLIPAKLKKYWLICPVCLGIYRSSKDSFYWWREAKGSSCLWLCSPTRWYLWRHMREKLWNSGGGINSNNHNDKNHNEGLNRVSWPWPGSEALQKHLCNQMHLGCGLDSSFFTLPFSCHVPFSLGADK